MHLLSTLMMPPYELSSNIVYFHDWRYVNHGSYRWTNDKVDPLPETWSRICERI